MQGILIVMALVLASWDTQPPGQRPPTSTSRSARIRPTTRMETCTTSGCHDDLAKYEVVHAPTAQNQCSACHKEVDPREHSFGDAVPRERMCAGCHVLTLREVVHQPVAVGDCTGCHDPHGSRFRMLLRADPATALCVTCHAEQAGVGRKFVHGPVAGGTCILCHQAHSSWHPTLLNQPAEETCLTCHAEVGRAVAARRHVHGPLLEGRCTDCHDAHASDAPRQLKGDIAGMCTSCHEPLGQKLQGSTVIHGPVAGENACIECHGGHASDLPGLQRLPQPAACLTCHDRELKDAAGRPLTDIATLLRDNPFHHGPIREGNCTACHDPHASSRFRLLTTEYPPDFYAPFDPARYALCLSCHRPELVTSSNGLGVTGFRDGDRNLHFVHVNQEKGRTCRACHEVHASAQPFHMREAVPFGSGNWMLEIKFQKLDHGGSCAPGCHKPATYDRGAPMPPPKGGPP